MQGVPCARNSTYYVYVSPLLDGELAMKFLILFFVWCVLLVVAWPLALIALVLWPVIWLISLPFRLIGITFDAVFALIRAILLLPARLLGGARKA